MIRTPNGNFITEEEYDRLAAATNTGSTITLSGSFFTIVPGDILFNTPDLQKKLLWAGMYYSENSSARTFEIGRYNKKDVSKGTPINIERYSLSALVSGTASISPRIINFPEHHSSEYPEWCRHFGFPSGTII